jgi:hypothetical protein
MYLLAAINVALFNVAAKDRKPSGAG